MQNKVFIARTKTALKSRAQLGGFDLNNYVILKINNQARQNDVLKSLISNIDEKEFKYLMVLKDFVVLTTDGGLRVDTNALSENDYAKELNTPEEEAPGDKFVVDGVVKSVLDKVAKLKGLTDEEREVVTEALKSWGSHDGESVEGEEEFVDELGETKSSHSEDEGEDDEDEVDEDEVETKSAGADEAETEDLDEDDEVVTKSVLERVSRLNKSSSREELMANLKSFGSIDEAEPVFQNKSQAQRFAQTFNSKSGGTSRAEVVSADRTVVRRYGTRAKFIVEINN